MAPRLEFSLSSFPGDNILMPASECRRVFHDNARSLLDQGGQIATRKVVSVDNGL